MKHKLRSFKNMGKVLKELRESHNISQSVVVDELKDLKVKCSKGTLSKIERGLMNIRADIAAALCLIYNVKPEVVLYKYKK